MFARRGFDLFRIAGVRIAIDVSWLIIFVLILWSLSVGYFPRAYPGYGTGLYWGIGFVATVLFFASVVFHELAHAMVGNAYGQRVRRITLFVFGGMAHLSREPTDPRMEVRIAAVGPLASLVLGAGFWAVSAWAALPPLWRAVFAYLAVINGALAVFNLLPGFPLDGGRLLRAVLWWRSGDLRAATSRAANWGAGIGFGVMALGIIEIFAGALVGGFWLVFIGMFLRAAARASYRQLLVEQALGHTTVRDFMIPDPVAIPADATVRDAVEQHFLRYGFAGFPVKAGDRIAGILSLRQVTTCPPEERDRVRVQDVMQPAAEAVEIPARASASEALRRMAENDTGRLLVIEDTRVIGLVTRAGIARYLHVRSALEGEDEEGIAAA